MERYDGDVGVACAGCAVIGILMAEGGDTPRMVQLIGAAMQVPAHRMPHTYWGQGEPHMAPVLCPPTWHTRGR